MKYWNAVLRITHGCTPCASGCAWCWAAREAYMRQYNPLVAHQYRGLVEDKSGPTFNGTVRVHPENIKKAQAVKKPRVWQIWNDLFHEAVPGYLICEVFALARMKKDHTFIALTKRPERMFSLSNLFDVPKNLYVGVSVTSAADCQEPLNYLLYSRAESKMISFEPCLGAIDLGKTLECDKSIKLVVCGGETGPKKLVRPCPHDAVWRAYNECRDAGVNFYMKQWGSLEDGHIVDGKEMLQLPWVL